MADLAKRIVGPTQLASAAGTVYTVPAATTTIMRCIHVANTSSSAASFTLSIGVDAAGTRLFSSVSVQANGYFVWSGFQVLTATEVLQVFGSAANVLTMTIAGVEAS